MDPMAGQRASRWELGQAAGRGRHHRCGLSKEKTTKFPGQLGPSDLGTEKWKCVRLGNRLWQAECQVGNHPGKLRASGGWGGESCQAEQIRWASRQGRSPQSSLDGPASVPCITQAQPVAGGKGAGFSPRGRKATWRKGFSSQTLLRRETRVARAQDTHHSCPCGQHSHPGPELQGQELRTASAAGCREEWRAGASGSGRQQSPEMGSSRSRELTGRRGRPGLRLDSPDVSRGRARSSSPWDSHETALSRSKPCPPSW